jgi:hypothetical protein
LFALPRNAIPVGAFKPAAKTDAVNPAGRMTFGGKVGLKKAVLSYALCRRCRVRYHRRLGNARQRQCARRREGV